MIYESRYWKDDLLKISARLVRRSRQSSSDERTIVKTEKDIFIGCYTIRKLIEAHKVTDTTRTMEVEVTIYPWLGNRVDIHNRSDWPELYDMGNGVQTKVKLSDFYNRIIHSFIFEQVFEESTKQLLSVVFNSDLNRNTSIYQITIDELTRVFRIIGKDDVVYGRFERDKITHDMIIKEL